MSVVLCNANLLVERRFARTMSEPLFEELFVLLLGVDFRDTGCNLRAFKRSVVGLIPPFDGFHRFMPVLAHSAGAVVKEIPVSHRPRVAGISKYGVWNRLGRGVYDLMMIRWYCQRQIKRVGSEEAGLS